MMIEDKVIGTLLSESDVVYDLTGIITPSMFVKYNKLAEWMWGKASKGLKWSVELAISDRIVASNIAYKLAAQSDRYRIIDHAQALRNLYISGKNKEFHKEALKKLDSGVDPDEVDAYLQSAKAGLNLPDRVSRDIAFKEAIEAIEKTGSPAIPSGIDGFDSIVGGLFDTEMIVIAARPGMGKTGFALTIAKHVVDLGKRVLVVSLEMGVTQILHRLVSMASGISISDIRNNKLTEYDRKRLKEYLEMFKTQGYHFENENKWSALSIKIEEVCRREMIDLLVIDYLQLIQSGNGRGNRESEVSDVSRGIKALANRLKIPVIALSQLSRAVESRGNKRPMLSDLRESGSIEQDADVVGFLYREGYYDQSSSQSVCEFIVAKMRNGATAVADLEFVPHLTQFK
jgi:replicative DNA helicase